jgi:3-oxoacyl-[acyl-carrier-protein] synthase-3
MTPAAAITHLASALPEQVVTNADLMRAFPEWDMDRMVQRTGVRSRHIAHANETSSDLGKAAAQKVLASSGIDAGSLDALVVCSQTHDYLMPGNSALLHHALGLRDDAMAFDLTLACSGFTYGLAVINGLIAAGTIKRALFITGDTYSKLIAPDDRSTRCLFGDGASAVIIERAGSGLVIGEQAFGTSGRHFDRFIVWAGGCRVGRPDWAPESSRVTGDVPHTRAEIAMDGMGVLSFFGSTVPPAVRSLLERSNLGISDIDRFVFHQASLLALETLQRALRIPDDRMVIDMADTGNLVSASVPVVLERELARGTVHPGQRVVLAGFGVGFSWGVVLVDVVA